MNANSTKIGVAVRSALAALAVAACAGSVAADVGVNVGVGVGSGGGVGVGVGVGGGGVGVGVNLDFGTCQRELSPYGSWAASVEYGNVWVPSGMPANWHPYSYGQWVYTDAGWYWQSNYSWGWLPFHYGRWQRSPDYGWCWVPGYVWAPAWVTWYSTDSYVGWAPLPACGAGVSFAVAPCDWFFVSFGSFTMGNLWCYSVPGYRVGPAVCSSYTVINNYYFIDNYYHCGTRRCNWYGPAPRVIEQHVNRRLEPYRITETATRSRNGVMNDRQLEVYRPGAARQLVQREVPERILTKVESRSAGRTIGAPRIGSGLTDNGRISERTGGAMGTRPGTESGSGSGRIIPPTPGTTGKEGTTTPPRTIGAPRIGTPGTGGSLSPTERPTMPVRSLPVERSTAPVRSLPVERSTAPVRSLPVERSTMPVQPMVPTQPRIIGTPQSTPPANSFGPARIETGRPVTTQPVVPQGTMLSPGARQLNMQIAPANRAGIAPIYDTSGNTTVERRSR